MEFFLNYTGLSSLHIELCLIALKCWALSEFCALQNAKEVLFRVWRILEYKLVFDHCVTFFAAFFFYVQEIFT